MEQRILELADYLIDRLSSRGVEVVTPAERDQHAGIVSFRFDDLAATRERLERRNVLISHRGEYLRVSPHFYNTEDELLKVLVVLFE